MADLSAKLETVVVVQFEIHRPDHILNLATITSDTVKPDEAMQSLRRGQRLRNDWTSATRGTDRETGY
jgi:hypothetical protein